MADHTALRDAVSLIRAFQADTTGAAEVAHTMTREELALTVGRLLQIIHFAVDDLPALVAKLEALMELSAREID